MRKSPSPRSLPTWNSMIRSSVTTRRFLESLFIYSSMRRAGLCGDNFTIPLVAKACAKLNCLRDGSKVHAHSILIGCEWDVFVQTSLVDMYSKCSAAVEARRMFDAMPIRNLVSWNCMISSYGRRETLVNTSFELLGRMRALGLKPNLSTFLGLVSGCGGSSGWVLPQGSSLHGYRIKLGLDAELCFSNSLIGMYMNCGSVDAALALFESMEERSAVSWTSVIGGYARAGDCSNALKSFNEMRRCDDDVVGLDTVSYLNLISACALSGSSSQVGAAHALTVKSGCGGQSCITNFLLNSYSRCQDLSSAEMVFNWTPEKDVCSWSSMIVGYAQNGCPSQALSTFGKMLSVGTQPNEVTITTMLSACADFGALYVGQKIDAYVKATSKKLESDRRVQTSLIHMYCRCGCVEKAREIFHSARCKDLAMWTCMISGYAAHGMGREALDLYVEMKRQGKIDVDALVFTGILSACGHSGLIEEGLAFFRSMQEDLHIDPSLEHHLCLVDMLCRGGQLDAALEAIQRMPSQVQTRGWSPFLSACRSHVPGSHLKEFGGAGTLSAAHHMQLQSCGDYVLVAQTYASLGRWKDATAIRRLMEEKGFVKQPGWSRRMESSICEARPPNTQGVSDQGAVPL
ncbi:hypothetical protein Taro_046823 [Colocasia esculenta]|uniref:Pentatricopeptide repeat-containing protein n=1 Tax=Colocasia esculenta TaxID=4460 RepID=A0A843WUP8_COLES|nr:hypothetical protein [Colocasia esculenta]